MDCLPPTTYHLPLTSHHKGQTLVEAMVSAGILTVGLIGILTLLAQSFYLNRVVTDNYKATYLAAEGIEVVKSMLDHNTLLNIGCQCKSTPWNQGFADGNYNVEYDSTSLLPPSPQPLNFDGTTGLYSYGFGNPTNFRRTIHVSLYPDKIAVSSVVTWSTGAFHSQIELDDVFYNWWPS